MFVSLLEVCYRMVGSATVAFYHAIYGLRRSGTTLLSLTQQIF